MHTRSSEDPEAAAGRSDPQRGLEPYPYARQGGGRPRPAAGPRQPDRHLGVLRWPEKSGDEGHAGDGVTLAAEQSGVRSVSISHKHIRPSAAAERSLMPS